MAAACVLAALPLLRGANEADAVDPARIASTRAPQRTGDALPSQSAPSRVRTNEDAPAANRSWAARRAPKAAAPSQATSTTPAEPQWDGKGPPSREWLRWQLSVLVEQGNPIGVSGGALDAAIDDALEAREARLAMESAASPEALVLAQERFETASRSLATNLGVEHVDLSAF